MGRGDRRTKRGKIFKQSYGKHRPAKKNTPAYVAKPKVAEDIIEKVVISKAETTLKAPKVIAEKKEKKVEVEKKPKVAKLEELTEEILVEAIVATPKKKEPAPKKAIVEKKPVAEKKGPIEKKAPAAKVAPAKKDTPTEKKAAAPKASKPNADAVKAKPAAKKAK